MLNYSPNLITYRKDSLQLIFLGGIFCGFTGLITPVFSVDFDDLETTRKKVYGSEKDDKYRFDAFFIEWENWPRENPDHNHFHFFWFASTTNYPKFRKNQILPFYYSIESKVDSRKQKNIAIFYESSVDKNGTESTSFFPFYFSQNNPNTNSHFRVVFPLFAYGEKEEIGFYEKFFIIPGYYSNTTVLENSSETKSTSASLFHYRSESTHHYGKKTVSLYSSDEWWDFRFSRSYFSIPKHRNIRIEYFSYSGILIPRQKPMIRI